MTTSNSTNFTINATEAIELAFQEINVLTEGDYLEQYDFDFAKKKLNMMLKAWQSQQNHLWVRQTATLFLQPGQNTYRLSDTSSDHSTVDTIAQTVLTATALLGATSITVSDSSDFAISDKIGIVLDNNVLFWSTVTGTPDSVTIQFSNPLTYQSTSGANVFGYTNHLGTPFQVHAGVRRDVNSKIDIPLNMMSYREYFDQPNKLSQGVPTMWAYDRQTDYIDIFLWLTPLDLTNIVRLIIARKIQDVDTNSDNFDFPQEWSEALVQNLAIRLAPSYGKAQGDNYQELIRQAQISEALVLNNDNELGSIYIKPSRDGFRRP